MNFERLDIGRRAQRIVRYHTMPTNEVQTVGAHTFGLMLILMELTDGAPSLNLIKAALYHDVAEAEVGDVPSPVLHKHPKLKEAIKEAEFSVDEKYGLLVELTDEEKRVLKLADRFECAMFSLEDAERGNHNGLAIAGRVLASLKRDGIIQNDNDYYLHDFILERYNMVSATLRG